MRALLLAPLLLLAACDSSDGLRLNADYYVGTWALVGVSDGSGDRTAQVLALTESLTIDFASSNAFALAVDFAPPVNEAGQEDVTLTGTYQAQPDLPALILRIDTFAPTFQATDATETSVSLVAPGIVVEQLLGPLQIDFSGDVTLRLRKQ